METSVHASHQPSKASSWPKSSAPSKRVTSRLCTASERTISAAHGGSAGLVRRSIHAGQATQPCRPSRLRQISRCCRAAQELRCAAHALSEPPRAPRRAAPCGERHRRCGAHWRSAMSSGPCIAPRRTSLSSTVRGAQRPPSAAWTQTLFAPSLRCRCDVAAGEPVCVTEAPAARAPASAPARAGANPRSRSGMHFALNFREAGGRLCVRSRIRSTCDTGLQGKLTARQTSDLREPHVFCVLAAPHHQPQTCGLCLCT